MCAVPCTDLWQHKRFNVRAHTTPIAELAWVLYVTHTHAHRQDVLISEFREDRIGRRIPGQNYSRTARNTNSITQKYATNDDALDGWLRRKFQNYTTLLFVRIICTHMFTNTHARSHCVTTHDYIAKARAHTRGATRMLLLLVAASHSRALLAIKCAMTTPATTPRARTHTHNILMTCLLFA